MIDFKALKLTLASFKIDKSGSKYVFIILELLLNTDFRKIRDKPNRMCRKASTAPDQAFIVEEALLEDLCAIAGEEAHEGGNIIL